MWLEFGKESRKQRRKWILQVGRRGQNNAGGGMINLRVQPCCRQDSEVTGRVGVNTAKLRRLVRSIANE